jgi:YVTN family beta-propeller protein
LLFALLSDARQLAIVDMANASIASKVSTPAEPTGLAIGRDGRRVYVTCAGAPGSVLEIDTASGQTTAVFPAGHTATAPTLSPDGKRLYVCNRFDHNVSAIDLVHRKELARVPVVREPIASALTPDGRELWVANFLPAGPANEYGPLGTAAAVSVIDTRTFQTAHVRLVTGATTVRTIAITPNGKYALLVHIVGRYHLPTLQVERSWMNANALTVVDIPRREVLNTVLLDDFGEGAANPWGVACTADSRWICISHAGTHELSIIDAPAILSALQRMPLEAFSNAAFFDGTTYGFGSMASGEDVVNNPGFVAGYRQRIKLPGVGPRGLAVWGSNVYVAEYFTDTIAAVPLQREKSPQPRTIRLGPTPQWNQVRRGEVLFHDARLCFQHWQSCATCHPDGRADALNWDLLNDGEGNPKNTKSILLSHQTPPAMASGVHATAEAAVRSGIKHILMSTRPEDEAAAIDAWLKSLKPLSSPFLVDGRLSPAAERGRRLFESHRVGCANCHPAPLYTDLKMHHLGPQGKPNDRETFDTPTLLEAWRTSPYLHDGRYATVGLLLTEGKHGHADKLSNEEVADLVQFVLSL